MAVVTAGVHDALVDGGKRQSRCLLHGEGVHTFSNGDSYIGAFENGKQHGQGTYTFSDGSVVVGNWQNGKPWQAIYADASEQEIGQYIDGIWYAN